MVKPLLAQPRIVTLLILAMTHKNLLNPLLVIQKVREWLHEDVPNFDYGGYVVGDKEECAVLLCKSPGILAGVPFFDAVFAELGCTVEWLCEEGEYLEPVRRAAVVRGNVNNILLGERLALNCISRASGVATVSRRLKEKVKTAGWKGNVAGTRKTTPGFRLVEKYALLVAGIDTHRYDLSSMIMLKDNHILAAGSISKAVEAARGAGGFSCKVEVECRSVEEALEAADAGADVVMLDNFQPEALHKAAKEIKDKFHKVLVESSGGVTEENILDLTGPHVDIISSSKTTQGYNVVDFSLKIQKEGHDPENPLVSL